MSTYDTLYGVIFNSSNFSCGVDAPSNATSIFGHVVYGGVPQNLLINFIVWVIMLLIFSILRRSASQTNETLLGDADRRWINVFYSSVHEPTEDDNDTDVVTVTRPQGAIQDTKTDDSEINNGENSHLQHQTVNDGSPTANNKWLFSWISNLIHLSLSDIEKKCGADSVRYLIFQQYMILLLVVYTVLSIGIILPVNIQGLLDSQDKFDATTITNINPRAPVLWLHTVFAVLYLLINIILMYRYSTQLGVRRNEMSSNTICVRGLPKNTTDKNLIKQHFEEAYNACQVTAVEFAYDIKLLTKYYRDKHLYGACLRFCQRQYDTTGERPMIGYCTCCNCRGCKQADGITYYTNNLELASSNYDKELQRVLSRSTGVAFITLSTTAAAHIIVDDYKLLKKTRSRASSQYSSELKSDSWEVKFAPVPANIIWENFSTNKATSWMKSILTNFALFFIFLFLTTPAIILAGLRELKIDFAASTSAFVTQVFPTIMLWAIGSLLPLTVVTLSGYEVFTKKSQLEYAVMVKSYVFLLFMIIILPSLALTRCVFLANNGAFFVNYLITSAFIGNASEILRLPEMVILGFKMLFTKSTPERETLKLKEKGFDFGSQYSWILVTITIAIIYSLSCPLVTPFGLVYLVLKHYTDKYNMYYVKSRTAYYDSEIHDTAISFSVFGTIMMLGCVLFYNILRIGTADARSVFTFVILIISLVFYFGVIGFNVCSRFIPKKKYMTEEDSNSGRNYTYLPFVLMQEKSFTQQTVNEDKTPAERSYGTYQ
ncbi:CSC1-like protein 2 [Trichoplax sp. H2]|nr:CSC1-like protein 2 [Trichoplax sp. H2]|eukprot:RDD46618.1 CSC1-like protein 2 [Trichoplax sp. H2]